MNLHDEIQGALREAFIGEFLSWRLAGATHVALGCQGFEPVTPQEARCRGIEALDIDADAELILENMWKRTMQALADATEFGTLAALSGGGGSA